MSLQQFYFSPSDPANKNSVILNDIKSDKEGEIMYDIPYMWNLKNDTNKLTKQKKTHKLREQAYDCQ